MLFMAAAILLRPVSALSASRATIEGSSVKEREIRWAWKYLYEFVVSCAASSSDCTEGEVKTLASQLSGYLPEWQRVGSGPGSWASLLEFVSEKDRPDIFRSDAGEVHRVAVTENRRNARIYINTDRMNLPLDQWIGLLVHEAAHHLGYDDGAKRLPDLVGAAVAAHFRKQNVSGDLEEFMHADVRLLVFNSLATGRVASAFALVGRFFSDIEMGTTPMTALCQGSEVLESQAVSAPFWRVSRIQYKRGIVSLRSSSTALMSCFDRGTQARRARSLAFIMEVDLLFAGALTPEMPWWTMTSKLKPDSVAVGLSDSAAELVTHNRAFAVVSMTHEKPIVPAGTAWKTKVILRSLQGRKPIKCDANYSGAQWAFHKYMNLPAIGVTSDCQLKDLGDGTWQVDLSTILPANTQPDLFYYPLLRLSEENTDFFALPKRPSYIRVENPQAKAPLKVSAWRILGLEPLKSYAGTKLPKAYIGDIKKPFWLEVDLIGEQAVQMGYIELKLIVSYANQLVFAPTSIRSNFPDPVLVKSEIVKINNGSRLRYLLQIPGLTTTLDVRGLSFARFYVQTDDHAWPELFTVNDLEGMVLERSVAK
jgi:hypothetical protein